MTKLRRTVLALFCATTSSACSGSEPLSKSFFDEDAARELCEAGKSKIEAVPIYDGTVEGFRYDVRACLDVTDLEAGTIRLEAQEWDRLTGSYGPVVVDDPAIVAAQAERRLESPNAEGDATLIAEYGFPSEAIRIDGRIFAWIYTDAPGPTARDLLTGHVAEETDRIRVRASVDFEDSSARHRFSYVDVDGLCSARAPADLRVWQEAGQVEDQVRLWARSCFTRADGDTRALSLWAVENDADEYVLHENVSPNPSENIWAFLDSPYNFSWYYRYWYDQDGSTHWVNWSEIESGRQPVRRIELRLDDDVEQSFSVCRYSSSLLGAPGTGRCYANPCSCEHLEWKLSGYSDTLLGIGLDDPRAASLQEVSADPFLQMPSTEVACTDNELDQLEAQLPDLRRTTTEGLDGNPWQCLAEP